MIKITELHKSFGTQQVLTGLSCELETGKLYGLVGPSGGGKSVLLKIIGQVSTPDYGQVELPINGPEEIGLMFQEGALFDSLGVFDNVAFPLVNGCVPTFLLDAAEQTQVYQKVSSILAAVGLSQALGKTPEQLSGGMRRRVSLARALVNKPKLALLDDPTAGLDPVASSVIMKLIVDLHREHRPTTIIASHDLRRLLPLVDCLLVLQQGRIVFKDSVNKLNECKNEEIIRFISCRYDVGRPHE